MNLKPNIYVFSGYSGAGKDTCAELVQATNIKFCYPGKRALEAIYNLPVGYLDDKKLRLNIAPHSGGKTYLQVLIDFWVHRDVLVGPDLFPEQVARTIEETLASGSNVAITDMRNANEVGILLRFKEKANIIPFWVRGGSYLSSDKLQSELCHKLALESKAHKPFIIKSHDGNPNREIFKQAARSTILSTEQKPGVL